MHKPTIKSQTELENKIEKSLYEIALQLQSEPDNFRQTCRKLIDILTSYKSEEIRAEKEIYYMDNIFSHAIQISNITSGHAHFTEDEYVEYNIMKIIAAINSLKSERGTNHE